MEQSGYPTHRFRVSSRDCALNGDLKHNKNRMIPQTQTTKSNVDEECLREARNTAIDEIGLKHPIMFDVYDVCSLARE